MHELTLGVKAFGAWTISIVFISRLNLGAYTTCVNGNPAMSRSMKVTALSLESGRYDFGAR
jgi:hypothetical protein